MEFGVYSKIKANQIPNFLKPRDEVVSSQVDSLKKQSHDVVPQNSGGQVTRPMGVSENSSIIDGDLDGSQVVTGYDRHSVPLLIDNYGFDESRPKNAYVHYLIKVKN